MKTLATILTILFLTGCGKDPKTINHPVIWDAKTIKYRYVNGDGDCETCEKVLDKIYQKTGISFVQVDEPGDYIIDIRFVPGIVAVSTVGLQKDSFINFPYDPSDYVLYHEFFHMLSLQHEHQQPNRNKHIDINLNNIYQPAHKWFKILSRDSFPYNVDNYEYDLKSIMHYHDNIYSNGKGPTMKTKKGGKIYKNNKPSEMDWQKLNDMYN